MNDKYLLEHIREIEKKLQMTKEKEEKLRKISLNIKKMCQSIIDINIVPNDKKLKIIKYLNSLAINLDVGEIKTFFNEGYLDKKIFFEILKNVNSNKYLIFVFKLRDSNEIDFATSFIESKFTSYLFLEVDKIVGIIERDKLKEFEKVKIIPFFKDSIYKELKFFVMFFEVDHIDNIRFNTIYNIFNRFYLKPSMLDKNYIHYSLINDQIIDFEAIKKEEMKKEFSFINDLQYPELEILIRKEIKNKKFVLALLDKIDSELKEIKQNKGRSIVVKRILLFIFRYQLDSEIEEMVKLILEALDREEYIKV